MRCVTRRPMMSAEPPGANGMITRIGLLGKFLALVCALTPYDNNASPTATDTAAPILFMFFIRTPNNIVNNSSIGPLAIAPK